MAFLVRLVWETRCPDGCARPKRTNPPSADHYWPDFLCATEKDCEEAEREGMRALANLHEDPHRPAEKQQLPFTSRKRRKIATQASERTIFLSLFPGLDILLLGILLHLSRWWLVDLLSGTLSRARARASTQRERPFSVPKFCSFFAACNACISFFCICPRPFFSFFPNAEERKAGRQQAQGLTVSLEAAAGPDVVVVVM